MNEKDDDSEVTSGNWGEERKCGRWKMKRNGFAGAAAPDARIRIRNLQPHLRFQGRNFEESLIL